MPEFFSSLRPWVAGTLPGWILVASLVAWLVHQWLKNQPILSQQKIDERLNIKTGYRETIQRLEDQVHQCHEESRRRERELQGEIDQLKVRLSNEALQRVQGEISLVQTLIQIVPDAAQLKMIMAGLEARHLRIVQQVQDEMQSEGADGDEREGA